MTRSRDNSLEHSTYSLYNATNLGMNDNIDWLAFLKTFFIGMCVQQDVEISEVIWRSFTVSTATDLQNPFGGSHGCYILSRIICHTMKCEEIS